MGSSQRSLDPWLLLREEIEMGSEGLAEGKKVLEGGAEGKRGEEKE